MGCSTTPESLQMMNNGMKDIKVVDNFVLMGALEGEGDGPAIMIAAGVTVWELYAAAAAKDRVVVGGAYPSIGVAGGYIQAGGHSPIGAWKG